MTILIKNWGNRCSRISWFTLTALEIKLGNYMYRYNYPWQASQCILFHFLQWLGLISSHNHNFKYNCWQYELSLTPFYWGSTCPPVSGSWVRRRKGVGGDDPSLTMFYRGRTYPHISRSWEGGLHLPDTCPPVSGSWGGSGCWRTRRRPEAAEGRLPRLPVRPRQTSPPQTSEDRHKTVHTVSLAYYCKWINVGLFD